MIELKHRKQDLSIIVILINLLFIVLGCKKATKEVETDLFSIRYPREVEVQNYTTSPYKGYQVIDDKDTLFYSIGYFISNLSEAEPNVAYIPDPSNYIFDSSIDLSKLVFTTRKHFDIDRYRRQNVYYERNIPSGIRKYTFPIDTNLGGIVGLYIDSISISESGILQFNAFVNTPSKGNYSLIYDALKSLKLKPTKNDEFYSKSTIVY